MRPPVPSGRKADEELKQTETRTKISTPAGADRLEREVRLQQERLPERAADKDVIDA